MPTFKAMRYAFPGSLRGLITVFSAEDCQKSPLGKPDLKSAQKTHLQAEAYLCIRLCLVLIFLYTSCFYNLMVCSHECRKTNKYTCMQTYSHLLENNFRKPGCGCVPALKTWKTTIMYVFVCMYVYLFAFSHSHEQTIKW